MDDEVSVSTCLYVGLIVFALTVCVVALPMVGCSINAEARLWQRAAISRGYATWEETADGDTEFVWLESEAGGE